MEVTDKTNPGENEGNGFRKRGGYSLHKRDSLLTTGKKKKFGKSQKAILRCKVVW